MHGGGCGGRSSHDDGVIHRTMFFKLAHHIGDRRLLLTDGNVNTLNAAALLIDDGIYRHCGLAGLTIADDQLTLATTDRYHRVDCLISSLYRLIYRLTIDHARRHALNRRLTRCIDRTLAVNRITQRINYTTQQAFTHGHFQNAASGLHCIAFRDVLVFTQHHRTHGILFEVQGQTEAATRKFKHFTVLHISQTVNTHDTVRYGHDCTDIAVFGCSRKLGYLVFDQVANFRCLDGHVHFLTGTRSTECAGFLIIN